MSTIRTRSAAERRARYARKTERATIRQQQADAGGIGNPVTNEKRRPPPATHRKSQLPTIYDEASPPRHVTTARMPARARAPAKQPDMLSSTLIAWVRLGPCSLCGRDGAVDVHHFPTRGSLGRTIDLLSASACRPCHDRCEVSPSHGGYSREQQSTAVALTLTRFHRLAPPELVAKVFTELLDSMTGSTT